jgi:hypothetical protein
MPCETGGSQGRVFPDARHFKVERPGRWRYDARVELEDLNHEERVALLALFQKVVAADGHVSDGEREEIAMLVDAFGEEGYRTAFDEAGANFGTSESLKAFLAKAGRPEARELIMGLVLEAAIPGAIEGHESELIEWLGKTWGIETSFEDEDDEGDDVE